MQTLQISACRRIVMLHQRPAEEGGGVELRQYVIKAAPTNVSRGAPRSSRSGNKPPQVSISRFTKFCKFTFS